MVTTVTVAADAGAETTAVATAMVAGAVAVGAPDTVDEGGATTGAEAATVGQAAPAAARPAQGAAFQQAGTVERRRVPKRVRPYEGSRHEKLNLPWKSEDRRV